MRGMSGREGRWKWGRFERMLRGNFIGGCIMEGESGR